MMKDRLKIRIASGLGGMGSSAVKLHRYVGGDGGNGGNVIFVGDENMRDLGFYTPDLPYEAQKGDAGESRAHQGSDGKDLILRVPLVTEILRDNGDKFFISEHGQSVVLAEGGRGGLGNATLNRQPTHEDSWDRMQNQEFELELLFKIKSDVIFLGFPNAGKSSLINELSNANYKVANYAFTTLEPQLGMMDGKILLDLPGLIEGTHEGKGLGTKFVQHTEYTKLIAHFVSLENEDPYQTYLDLRGEIEQITEALAIMPEIVILTKMDEVSAQKVAEQTKIFAKKGIEVTVCSVLDDESITKVKERLIDKLATL